MSMEDILKANQKAINAIGKIIGFAKPLDEKEFIEIDKGHFVSVDKYLEKQRREKAVK